jgi:hypothetical protein
LLALVVGGSALVACITIFTGHNLGLFAAMLAGLIMVGYIIVEALILKQVPPGPMPQDNHQNVSPGAVV